MIRKSVVNAPVGPQEGPGLDDDIQSVEEEKHEFTGPRKDDQWNPYDDGDIRDPDQPDDSPWRSVKNNWYHDPRDGREITMGAGYEGRKKIMQIIERVVKAAKDVLGMEKLADLAKKLWDIKAKMEGAAVAWREDLAAAVKADEELQKFINDDEALSKLVKARGNYDPASVYAALGASVDKLEASFLKSKEQEKQIGEIKLSREKVTEKASDRLEDAKRVVEDAKAALEEAEANLKKAEESANDVTKTIAKSNIEKLYKAALEEAKEWAKDELARSKKKEKAPEEKAPSKAPSKPAGPGLGDFNKLLEEKKRKEKEEADKSKGKTPAKTSLDGVAVTAADSEAALMAKLDEIQALASSLSGGVESVASAMDAADSAIANSVAAAESAASMMAEAPADEGEESPSDDAEEPGMFDGLMDTFMPAPQMEMVPVPASVTDAWYKESSQEAGMEKEADVKRFPSEHDMSSGSFELVESDGKKQLLVKKDLKSKVTQKIQDHLEGKYRKAELVAVDMGDRIVQASVVKYDGNGRYEVVSEGRSMKVPDEQIFKATDIWR